MPPQKINNATHHGRRGGELGLVAAPRVVLVAANNWGRWASERPAWGEAGEAYQSGLDALRRLVGLQASRQDKETWLRGMRRIATTGLANARAMSGDGKAPASPWSTGGR